MRINSLKWFLIISINTLMLFIFAISGTMAYVSSLDELDEVYDAQLAHTARMLVALKDHSKLETSNLPVVIPVPNLLDTGESQTAKEQRQYLVHKYENKIAFQLWSDNALLMRSENVADFKLSKQNQGYHEIRHAGTLWITYSLYDPQHNLWAYTAQREDVRQELSENLAKAVIRPLVFSFIPISVSIYLLIFYFIRPISNLSNELIKRGQANLSEIEIILPNELQPILHAINNLLTRVASYLNKEKRFIADASHELRTPLAVMKIHAQNLASTELNKGQVAAVSAINKGCDNMSHLVDQLLALAKLESDDGINCINMSLRTLIEEAMSQLSLHYLERRQWSINADGYVSVDPVLMQIALRNILENAAKYSHKDDVINIYRTVKQGECQLVIENTVTYEPELERLEERFYRHRESQAISGSGLGLSIVKLIVVLHKAKIEYKTSQGRFQVLITFNNLNN